MIRRLAGALGAALSGRLIARATRRPPDYVIGPPHRPYMRRWWLIPRNRWVNAYLHNIRRSDDDRALHDHPWANLSIVLRGGYWEVLPTRGGTTRRVWRAPGSLVLRRPSAAHRLEVARPGRGPVWTLFLTGPRLRVWGFWCPQGWVPWQHFTGGARGELVGRGCGEAP